MFLIAQPLDGTLGNPILVVLMESFGHGPALLAAKVVASVLRIALHLARVHVAVALLAGFHVTAAVLPWTALLAAAHVGGPGNGEPGTAIEAPFTAPHLPLADIAHTSPRADP